MVIARNVLMEVTWADKCVHLSHKCVNKVTEVFLRKKGKGFIFKYASIVEVIRGGGSKHLIFYFILLVL